MRSSPHALNRLAIDPTDLEQDNLAAPDALVPPMAMFELTGSTTATAPTQVAAGTPSLGTTTTPGVALAKPSVLAGKGQAVTLGSMFSIGASSANPTYLIVSGLDRNEYTAGIKTSGFGHLAAGNTAQNFSNFSGDGWSVSVVYTYNATTGQYVNATYGNLSQLTFDTGTNVGDTATFTLFGTSNASLATYAANPLIMASNPGYFTDYGSVAVLTGASAATAPASATPTSIETAALGYVGATWNNEGCWVLASDISAKAGATLPLTSSMAGVAGIGNGEWFVAYNGPVSASSGWLANLVAGEMVGFITASGGGHITTVVSGQGSTAQLVDNITMMGANGQIADSANDGSSADVIVQAPHAASQEFNGVNPANVVVYELDCPVVKATLASVSVVVATNVSLAADFTASNPKSGQSVTQYQVYETNAADALMLSGVANKTAISAANACTLTNLSGLSLTAANSANSDTIDVRAYNGSYWGDWTAITVNVTAPASVKVAAALQTSGLLSVSDTAANISAQANALQTLAAAGRLTAVTVTDGKLVAVTLAQMTSDHSLLALLPASDAISVAGVTVAQAASLQSNAQVGAYTIADTVANVSAGLTALQSAATSGKLTSITLSNPSTVFSLSVAQVSSDAAALALIGGSYQLALTGATVATAASLAAVPHVASVAISDSAANVYAGLNGLQTLAAAGKLSAITLSDTSTPTISLTATQFFADTTALGLIGSNVKFAVTAATVAQAASLQANAKVSYFTATDTVATVSGNTALGADNKLCYLGVLGTSGADTLNMTGITAQATINLGGNTASVSGGMSASTMSFITPPDIITLGAGVDTIVAGLTSGCGIVEVNNFQFGHDVLQIGLGSLTALNAYSTSYNGAHAISLTGGGLTEGVLLINQPASVTAASILASHVHVSGGVATVT